MCRPVIALFGLNRDTFLGMCRLEIALFEIFNLTIFFIRIECRKLIIGVQTWKLMNFSAFFAEKLVFRNTNLCESAGSKAQDYAVSSAKITAQLHIRPIWRLPICASNTI